MSAAPQLRLGNVHGRLQHILYPNFTLCTFSVISIFRQLNSFQHSLQICSKTGPIKYLGYISFLYDLVLCEGLDVQLLRITLYKRTVTMTYADARYVFMMPSGGIFFNFHLFLYQTLLLLHFFESFALTYKLIH